MKILILFVNSRCCDFLHFKTPASQSAVVAVVTVTETAILPSPGRGFSRPLQRLAGVLTAPAVHLRLVLFLFFRSPALRFNR